MRARFGGAVFFISILAALSCQERQEVVSVQDHVATAPMYERLAAIYAAWPAETSTEKQCPDTRILAESPDQSQRKVIWMAWLNFEVLFEGASPWGPGGRGSRRQFSTRALAEIPKQEKVVEGGAAKRAMKMLQDRPYMVVWRPIGTHLARIEWEDKQYIPGRESGELVVFDYRSAEPLCWFRADAQVSGGDRHVEWESGLSESKVVKEAQGFNKALMSLDVEVKRLLMGEVLKKVPRITKALQFRPPQ